jgi:predicted enzyme related to lactoylglutathione lyase
MPYMNIHTPLDEIGRRIMTEQIRSKTNKNSTVQDVVSALNRLGEFKNAITKIKIRVGKPENPAGKVVVSHGAGTNGGYEIAKAYFQHGIGTVIYIHVNPADVEKLRAENKGNLIVTGHIASDSLGINPFLRALEKEGVSVTTIGVIPDSEKDSA